MVMDGIHLFYIALDGSVGCEMILDYIGSYRVVLNCNSWNYIVRNVIGWCCAVFDGVG